MRHWRITRNSNVPIQTESTYISDSMTDITAIPTANLGFSTTPSSQTLTLGNSDNDRQAEIAIWTFWSPILQFLTVARYRNHLANLLSSSTSSKIPNLALEFRRYLSECERRNYFRFRGPYRYFRLSIPVIVTGQHYFTSIHGLIPQICRWNFNCTFHSWRHISISGFGRHFRSDCRPLLESPRYASCEFATVECRRFAVEIFMIYVTLSEILLLPVSWLPSWILDTK